ncbi:MAG: phosphoenolpyruvate--protein phosphotransferase [Lentisphaerae bacterium RIFOXYB12_FULL_65_16]|nr:MAG: phosphoenolpyruvate--protein phosphotransferase [Lentisphaerae bacterium RIFOXYA12_64_32]OGV92953.1 MAG: phosphoenolpyruvate--protein phosphotransferase [Lentisphaerae bacterium RIFOXYB12_FULL_65_16]
MKKDNVDLICSVGELAGIFEKSQSLDQFLQQVVSTVAWHMRAAVCSVYLLHRGSDKLVLTANQGLNPAAVGTLRLRLGEGIVGTAVRELRAIREAHARNNPHFKPIPDLDEEQYEAFLVVPILRGSQRIGALVVQDPQPNYFDENDEKALRAIAAQLASTIENANLLLSLHPRDTADTSAVPTPAKPLAGYQFLRGIAASGGFAQGVTTVLAADATEPLALPGKPPLADPQAPMAFEAALARTEAQISRLQADMEEKLADVASLIFSAHLLILKDEPFSGEMRARIQRGHCPATAVVEVVNEFIHLFSQSPNAGLREKVLDVKDLGHRLLRNLSGSDDDQADYRGQVLIATNVLPSDLLKLSAQQAAAVVLVGSGAATHLSVLARSLNLPMVVVNDRRLFDLPEGTPVLVDGNQGTLFIRPGLEVAEHYEKLKAALLKVEVLAATLPPETRTADGCRVRLLANINLVSDVSVALRLRAEGVGLYRTEFPFIVRNDLPSEEEQYRIYAAIVREMHGREVTFRTLDIGGDKALSYFPIVNEANPFLGLRAIRFSLRYREFFAPQLRALLRAGVGGPMRIMFPMIASLDDFLAARDVVWECVAALKHEGIPCIEAPVLGVMVELPAAVEIAEDLAREAEFLSLGSNDLVQYMLAVDRTNARVADFYRPDHPAVLRALSRVVRAGQRFNRPVSICGDMAGNPKFLPFLLGIGLRSLSLDARHIPAIKQAVTGIRLTDAEALAARVLQLGRCTDIARELGLERPPEEVYTGSP